MTITQAVSSWKTTEAEGKVSSASICYDHRSCDSMDSPRCDWKTLYGPARLFLGRRLREDQPHSV